MLSLNDRSAVLCSCFMTREHRGGGVATKWASLLVAGARARLDGPVFVSRLSLSDFRSYADALITPGAGFVVLTGENGAGKTNVLEAVSLLSPGRGLRGATLSEMACSTGAGGFAVAARLSFPLPARREGAGVGASSEEAGDQTGGAAW